jgi:YbbR domain-containing protein
MIAIARQNLGLRVLSLVLAIAIWGFIGASDPVAEWPMQLAVVVRLSPGMAVVSQKPESPTIDLYVRGRISQLGRLQQSSPRAVLDGRGLTPEVPAEVQPHLDPSLRGIRTEFMRQKFELVIDIQKRAEFQPVEVTEGQLPAGYFIDSRYGVPQTLVVEGATPLVDQVAKVVYRLNLSSLTGSTELSVQFEPIDASGAIIPYITVTPPTADIGISLQPSQAVKTVPVVVDYKGNPAANRVVTGVSFEPSMVGVSGPPERLSSIVNIHTSPIDLTGKAASFEQQVSLLPPGGVTLVVNRTNVTVTIEELSTVTNFSDLAVDVRGGTEAYTYEISPAQVEVVVEGTLTATSGITSDLIRPQVNVEGLEPGEHEVRVSVDLPTGVKLNSVDPPTVKVTISVNTGNTGGNSNPGDGSN